MVRMGAVETPRSHCLFGSFGGAPTNADGDGPLGSIGGPGHESVMVPQTALGSTTYGIHLCVTDPAIPATIADVRPIVAVGTGFRTLGVGVREFLPSGSHAPIISVEGFPPPPTF